MREGKAKKRKRALRFVLLLFHYAYSHDIHYPHLPCRDDKAKTDRDPFHFLALLSPHCRTQVTSRLYHAPRKEVEHDKKGTSYPASSFARHLGVREANGQKKSQQIAGAVFPFRPDDNLFSTKGQYFPNRPRKAAPI
jgi:hypothetical protein